MLGADARQSENPWDDAHRLLGPSGALAAAGGPGILEAEPDIAQQWPYGDDLDARGLAAGVAPACAFEDQDTGGGRATGPGLAWHLRDDFSQLAAARMAVGGRQDRITIAHLDTGFDPGHMTAPKGMVPPAIWRNFCDDGHDLTDARDHAPAGGALSSRGHGTGTLSLLAGNRLDGSAPSWPGFTDFIGGAPGANIIPVRIADWVVRFTVGSMVRGIDHARQQAAQVLSMSMGGLSSAALVDAINLAYDHGLVMVTAAGNNFAARPSPKSIVFPARYQRVLAACGVMADGRAYAGLGAGTMQGNFGPTEKMRTALGAFTPNVPWAEIDCANVVDMDGAGTSAATPQIAAAAALWLAEHWDVVQTYSQPWMRVEACRHALFAAALKSTVRMDGAETLQKLGQGVLQAQAALAVQPLPEAQLRKLPPAVASWSWLDLLFGGGVSLAPDLRAAPQMQRMLALELTQMAQRVAAVDAAIPAPETDPDSISPAARNRYLEAALDAGNPSKPLRALLERALGRPPAPPAAPLPRQPAVIRRAPRPLPPPMRRLRIFALDPSIGKRLDSIAVNQATLSLPWDDQPATASALQPGPIGEYLEVVDVDPASDRIYEPVDLNDKILLAQDGHAPSEGNPQFHQQMVYAVAMTTIGHFERALGRRALWAPRYDRDGKGREVRRLRLYPHALRTENAYYSSEKMALLFGYFPADSRAGASTPAGTMVFTCLSSDIIAHETSHALLDGLHRSFQEASNPDVLAFHEGFADIVALFQHFTLTELVAFEIARAGGDLKAANLLSGLAQQFGEGSGRDGPLRNYGKAGMEDLDYDTTFEPHSRGSILVFAVYEAFLAIVARRTAPLIRLASGGSGLLPAGALHPELVARLTEETVTAARHVLTICIRALDFCPAVDLSFGEYLRALITADIDAFPDDRLHYRLAFMESFRRWKLLPRDMRTVSEQTLAWGTMDDPRPVWLPELLKKLDLGWNQKPDRSAIFALNESNRWAFWSALTAVLARDPGICRQFGLIEDLPRYNANGTLLRRARKGGTTFDVLGIRPTRRVEPDGSFRIEVIAVIQQRIPLRPDGTPAPDGVAEGEEFIWFRGGATVVIDPRKGHEEIRYAIIKNTDSAARQKRQAGTAAGQAPPSLRALYFGEAETEPFALLHMSHGDRDDGEESR